MKGRQLNEQTVLKSLSKKRIKIIGKEIMIPENQKDLGNKSWGMIDFLIHYCGYFAFYEKNGVPTTMIHRELKSK